MVNFRIVIKLLGVILLAMGLFMILPLLVTIFTSTGEIYSFLISSGICIALGLPFVAVKPKIKSIGKREGYMIVALSWFIMSLAGMLPYLLEGVISSLPSAFFESASGLTTTGATIFTDIESLPHGILFWRSFTQWIGGMGIIVLTVAVIPIFGVGGMNIFSAESPGPTKDKVHPKIKESAKRLWLIYTSLTLLLFLILHFFSGLSWFDAINHAFTTMSTGGFSTKNASIAHWNDPMVQYPIIVFMFLAGTNFTILYFLIKRKFDRVRENEEFRVYLIGVILLVTMVTVSVLANVDKGFEESVRMSLFQVVSIVTTTGFVTEDYMNWSNGLTMGFFMLLFTGACAGSTSGGIKVVRHIVFSKNTILEFKRLMHPRALLRVKLNKEVISGKIAAHVLVFLLVYLMIFCLGSILIMRLNGTVEKPFLTAIGAVATSLGNVGPGLGSVGPVNNFAHLPDSSKMVLSALMIIGRLELFSVLIIFAPSFWRSN